MTDLCVELSVCCVYGENLGSMKISRLWVCSCRCLLVWFYLHSLKSCCGSWDQLTDWVYLHHSVCAPRPSVPSLLECLCKQQSMDLYIRTASCFHIWLWSQILSPNLEKHQRWGWVIMTRQTLTHIGVFPILTMESEAAWQFKWVKDYLNTFACFI